MANFHRFRSQIGTQEVVLPGTAANIWLHSSLSRTFKPNILNYRLLARQLDAFPGRALQVLGASLHLSACGFARSSGRNWQKGVENSGLQFHLTLFFWTIYKIAWWFSKKLKNFQTPSSGPSRQPTPPAPIPTCATLHFAPTFAVALLDDTYTETFFAQLAPQFDGLPARIIKDVLREVVDPAERRPSWGSVIASSLWPPR